MKKHLEFTLSMDIDMTGMHGVVPNDVDLNYILIESLNEAFLIELVDNADLSVIVDEWDYKAI